MCSQIKEIFNKHDRLIEDLKVLTRNGHDNNSAYEYFNDIKTSILLEREEIKLAVDTHYLDLCEEIDILQNKCMQMDTASILESTKITVQIYEREIIRMKRGLSDFASGFESWDSCYREAEYLNRELEKNIDIYKSQLLGGLHCEFNSNDVIALINKSSIWINHEKPIKVTVR